MPSISTFHSKKKADVTSAFPCNFFNGKTSKPKKVKIIFSEKTCILIGRGVSKEININDITVSEPFKNSARIIRFKDGSFCEIVNSEILNEQLTSAGYKPPVSFKLQHNLKLFIMSFLLLIIVLAAGYRWGLPVISDAVSKFIPQNALEYLTAQTLKSVDGRWFFPSKLSEKRKNKILKLLKKVKFPADQTVTLKVEFRNSEMLGINAFALPNGSIIFLDGLINAAKKDKDIIAVYVHEAGHVFHRHTFRQLIQNSVIAAILAVYIGDVSSLVGGLTGWVLESKYSRDFEFEADLYASKILKFNKISPLALSDFLFKIEKKNKKPDKETAGTKFLDYISTHPSTEERRERLE